MGDTECVYVFVRSRLSCLNWRYTAIVLSCPSNGLSKDDERAFMLCGLWCFRVWKGSVPIDG